MKLILNESQYNRIFNTKKRKLVITESQYKRLLVEANVSNSLLDIDKSDTIKLVTKGGDKLHFKVVAKNGNEIMMINCNDGVYKNAYFYINGSSYSNGNLSYRIAQNKDIDDKNPWETLKGNSDVWRNSTFKNLAEFKIYKDGGEGLTCNLSDNAKEKFGIDLKTGDKIEPKVEVGDKDKPKVSIDTQINNSLNRLYEGYKYKLMLVEPNVDKDGKMKLTDFGSMVINVIKRQGNRIEFEVDEVEGAGGEIYKDMVGKLVSFVLDKKNIDVPDLETDKMVFDIKVTLFTDETDDEKNRVTEEQVIANISAISNGIKTDVKDKDSEDEEDGFNNLSPAKMEELVKRLVTDSEYLNAAILKRPNWVLGLLKLSRDKGIIPTEGRLAKWGISVSGRSKNAIDKKRFPVNRKFISNFMSFDIKDKSLSSGINLSSDFEIKSMQDNANVNNKKFGTNFGKNIKLEEEFKYVIYLKKELEEKDDFYVYEVQVFFKESQNKAGKEVGTGRLKILKEEK